MRRPTRKHWNFGRSDLRSAAKGYSFDPGQSQRRPVEQAVKCDSPEKNEMPRDQSPSEMAATLTARVDAVARIYALLGEDSGRAQGNHASTVIDRARFAVASGEAASLQSALESIDLLSFELCDE